MTTMNAVVSFLVILPFWTYIVLFIGTTFLGDRSKMYKAATKEKLVYERETAKFAASAAVAAHVFASAEKTSEHGLTQEDVKNIFLKCPSVKPHTAKQLAKEMFKSMDQEEDGAKDGVIELKEWVNYCCSDVCQWEHFEFSVDDDADAYEHPKHLDGHSDFAKMSHRRDFKKAAMAVVACRQRVAVAPSPATAADDATATATASVAAPAGAPGHHFCTSCGAKLETAVTFCSGCGIHT
jgi:hypothetical protein